MRKIVKFFIYTLILTLILQTLMVSAAIKTSATVDFRGLWVATVANMDYPSRPTTDPEILKSEAVRILDSAKNTGFNAVFLQVRPAADALYKSQYFPWSKYLTGYQGVAVDEGFDPLEFWANEAHKRGIELHAWINPYRVTKREDNEPRYDFASLASSNPARLNPDWVVKHSDGNLYFNPGIPEVRKLVIDSVLEIINNYDVDGIHFDDYFYPGKDFDDKVTYERYGAAYGNIDDWRRSNVDTLISDLSKAIRDTRKEIRFGVSPFGIWANKSKNPLGSNTEGIQSYYDHYADTRKWVNEGYLDYIAPQIYWNIGYSIADYSKLVAWWSDIVHGTGVDLYIGQAAYRSGSSNPSSPWYGVAEIDKQMQLNAKTNEVKGSIFFNYSALNDNPALNAVVKAIYEKRDGITSGNPVSIASPSQNIRTSYSKFYLYGASDPDRELFINGALVENRSNQGYYGMLVPLQIGVNIFTLSQKGSYATRVICREADSVTSGKMNTIDIPASSAFPQSAEYRTPGEEITLSCSAPIGSYVTVKISGESFEMSPSTTISCDTGIYPATYKYVYTVPSYTGNPRNIDLGAPVYTMNYNGKVITRSAPAKIGVIMKGSPYYARVVKDVIDTYSIPSSSNGTASELYKGMTDYITGMTGAYVRLSSGQWVKKSRVNIFTKGSQIRASITKAVYKTSKQRDTLQLNISTSVAVKVSFDGTYLNMGIPIVEDAVLPKLPEDSLFSSISLMKNSSQQQYILTLKDGQRIDGYYIEKTSSGLALHIKKHSKVKNNTLPLTGISVMVDPGHGGRETGAIGHLGLKYPEKAINLETGLKLRTELQKLGARVIMTRSSDKTLSLEDRLAASRKSRPDIYISMHANSMEDNVDISKIEGFSVFYREIFAETLAQGVLNNIIGTLNRNDQGIHMKNFYVTRGTWTPSILLESGFMPNPEEFEWLTDGSKQTQLAKSIAEAVVKYFSN